MTEAKALLAATGLSKHYGQKQGGFLLAPFDLVVHARETIGIVGQSGSGKSTIAKLLMGMTAPTSGQINFKQTTLSVARTKDQRQQIQYIFQNPYSALDPRLTIRKLLSEPLQFYFDLKGEALEKRLIALLSSVELTPEILDKKPAALSGGQCQRVGIVRALAAKPSLIICDEPTSALDAFSQMQVLKLLQKIQADTGVSLIFISHALEVVYQLADYLYVFQHGRLVEEGARTQIYTKPQVAYTRALLEAVPSRGIN
ncbi:MAG: ATP-binding cassette domain-containing protein [Lactobacillus sp.]|jgi:ABC-type glutathione transport system ATPase component|nr:ATP-binding cassette domain-containing protein [Lactobacillus sp.]MCI2033956.1 ATP-binding cassette domain-containing protein [Lactobacillus sp.]